MDEITEQLNNIINNTVNKDHCTINWDDKSSADKWSKKEIMDLKQIY